MANTTTTGGSSRRRRDAEALRLELERSDDVGRRQLAEHRRLSADVEEAQSQLNREEERLVAMLTAGCDGSPLSSSSTFSSSSDVGKLSQPLDVKSAEFLVAERQRHLEKDRGKTARSCDPHGQIAASTRSSSTLSLLGVTRLETSRNDRNDDKYTVSKSRKLFCSNIIASDTLSEDTGCGSLSENSDLFIDGDRLTTLV